MRHTPVSARHLSTDRTGTRVLVDSSSSASSEVDGVAVVEPRPSRRARSSRACRRERPVDVVGDHPAEERLVEAVARHGTAAARCSRRAAVVLADDHVLRDVDETPRQVPRVGRAERRVGEALAGAVGRDEVLEHRQALHEVGLDRALDDLALRIRHQAAHAGELADLLERSAGAGVGHHEDGFSLVRGWPPSRRRPRRSPPSRCSTIVSCRSSSVIRPRSYCAHDLRRASRSPRGSSPSRAGPRCRSSKS